MALETRVFAEIPFVKMPEGSFFMGSPDSEKERWADEGPIHRVCLDSFWIGAYPITQKQWTQLMGTNPSHFNNGGSYPVENVSWENAQEYIAKLNQLGVGHFSLPTEAQWEYAARAGTTTPFSFGSTINYEQANFDISRQYDIYRGYCKTPYIRNRESTTPVGAFPANPFGLYDMHGNVFEWVQDCYSSKFYASPEAAQRNPQCTDSAKGNRILRGGSWSNDAGRARSASRDAVPPNYGHPAHGFRVVRGE